LRYEGHLSSAEVIAYTHLKSNFRLNISFAIAIRKAGRLWPAPDEVSELNLTAPRVDGRKPISPLLADSAMAPANGIRHHEPAAAEAL